MRDHPEVVEAARHWKHGMSDLQRPGKEQADRAYLVVLGVAAALDDYPNPRWAGGGEIAVCSAIRSVVPLSPPGFSKVGKLEGRPTSPPVDSMLVPYRMATTRGIRHHAE